MKSVHIGVFALAIGVPGVVLAQAPVAVPIVGSPAAQQPRPQAPAPSPQGPMQVPALPPVMSPAAPSAPMPDAAGRTQRKLELTLKDGTVALDAQNVTLRDILTEWQKRSGCQFVNADKLPAAPVTMQFPAGTPELKAIDSLLHGLGTATTGYGYMVAPRSATDPTCGAVYILATSRPSAVTSYSPTGSSPIAAPLVTPGSPDDEIPPVTGIIPNMPPQPRPMPGQMPNPGIPPNPMGQPNQNPAGSAPPAPQGPNFGPVAPMAPGAGRIGGPPATPPTGGRGGGQ
jgi:hypothetical protein